MLLRIGEETEVCIQVPRMEIDPVGRVLYMISIIEE